MSTFPDRDSWIWDDRHEITSAQINQDYYQRFGTPLRPASRKGPLVDDLAIYGDVPELRIMKYLGGSE
jgi:hypothetical protein